MSMFVPAAPTQRVRRSAGHQFSRVPRRQNSGFSLAFATPASPDRTLSTRTITFERPHEAPMSWKDENSARNGWAEKGLAALRAVRQVHFVASMPPPQAPPGLESSIGSREFTMHVPESNKPSKKRKSKGLFSSQFISVVMRTFLTKDGWLARMWQSKFKFDDVTRKSPAEISYILKTLRRGLNYSDALAIVQRVVGKNQSEAIGLPSDLASTIMDLYLDTRDHTSAYALLQKREHSPGFLRREVASRACNTLLNNSRLDYNSIIWVLTLMKTFDLELDEGTVVAIKTRQEAQLRRASEKEGRPTVLDPYIQRKATDIIMVLTIGVNGYSTTLSQIATRLEKKYNYDSDILAAIMTSYTKKKYFHHLVLAVEKFKSYESKCPQKINGSAVARLFVAYFRCGKLRTEGKELLQKYIASLNTTWKFKDAVLILGVFRRYGVTNDEIDANPDAYPAEFFFLTPSSDQVLTLEDRKRFVIIFKNLGKLLYSSLGDSPTRAAEANRRLLQYKGRLIRQSKMKVWANLTARPSRRPYKQKDPQ